MDALVERATARGIAGPALREPNAIDFWRGFALLTIFINHVPGTAFERFTYSHFSISDAAELFVFLAGWAIALAVRGRQSSETPGRVVLRLTSRTVEVYRAQIVITAMAVAMIAATALASKNPLVLEWHNAGPVFADPVPTTIGWVLLMHQLGYFNILPLYVALLALSPVFVLLARVSRWITLGLSLALYAVCLTFGINLPTWPVEGSWFFNPLAWQLLLVLGFLSAELAHDSELFRAWMRRLMPLGMLGVAIGIVVAVWDLKPDPLTAPEPRLFFVLDKSNLSPGRLVHFLTVALAFQRVFPVIARLTPWLAQSCSALGRNSLAVFSMSSIASLGAQLARFVVPHSFILDFALISAGFLLLVLEFRVCGARLRQRSLFDRDVYGSWRAADVGFEPLIMRRRRSRAGLYHEQGRFSCGLRARGGRPGYRGTGGQARP